MKPHIYHPHAGDLVRLAGDQPEQLAGDQPEQLAGDPTKPNPDSVDSMLLMIAREEVLVWKSHLANFIAQWDALGVYGFVCRDQAKVADFLSRLAELKSILRG